MGECECLTLTHSYIHLYTDGAVNHARKQPAGQEQLGLGILLRDTSKFSLEEPGIQPATFQWPDNLLYLLSHCHPQYYTSVIKASLLVINMGL